MIKPTLYAKWISLVFAALVLAACSSNDTKEAEAAAAAAAAAEEQAAQEAAVQEAEQQAQAEAQQGREAAAADAGTVFYFEFDSSSLTEDARAQVDAHVQALLGKQRQCSSRGPIPTSAVRENIIWPSVSGVLTQFAITWWRMAYRVIELRRLATVRKIP